MNNYELSSTTAQQVNARFSWRTEPEVDSQRQEFLRQCLAIVPDIQHGSYPFKGVRLTRADVEWLLVIHEHGLGPIDWNDLQQRERVGVDLRGADLHHVNLRGLPLARIRGGLTKDEWVATTLEQRSLAGVHLEGADLSDAHLEGAILRGAFLQGATLRAAQLQQVVLFQAHLEQAYLRKADLGGANMMYAHLEGAYFRKASIAGADLRHAICDNATNIEKVTLIDKKWGCVLLADIHWGDCNLAVLNWRRVMPLGDEVLARELRRQQKRPGTEKEKRYALDTIQASERAYRQLANAMRAQGMNDEAVPYAYRALTLQRTVLWYRLRWGSDEALEEQNAHIGIRSWIRRLWQRTRLVASYLFSGFLDIVAGFGYKPERSLFIYLLTVLLFALVYHFSDVKDLPLHEALILSITSFHGRGFINTSFSLASPITALAAVEAVIGLFIEISFIATFTQRFFGR